MLDKQSSNPDAHTGDKATLQSEETVTTTWWQHALWLIGAGVIGFAVAAVFAGRLQLPRRWFLIPHLLLSGGLVAGYFWWSEKNLSTLLKRHWLWGVVGAIVAGAFLVSNVLSQPASEHSSGVKLLLDLFWLGIVYGLLDALLLSVLPIIATRRALAALGWTTSWPGRVVGGVLAILASLTITAAYHLGFPEFQGSQVVGPIIGNGVSSLAAVASTNPLGALLSHLAMHIAAVFQGPGTTIQLPPHY